MHNHEAIENPASCSNCFRQEVELPITIDGQKIYWVLTEKTPLFAEPQRQMKVAFLPMPLIKADEPEIQDKDLFCAACFDAMASGGHGEMGETADV